MEPTDKQKIIFALANAVWKFRKFAPTEPLAICVSPPTAKQIKSVFQETSTRMKMCLPGNDLPIFEFEELPESTIIIKSLADVQEILKARIAWKEWLRNG